jgi:hypothetical protein
MAGNPPLAAEKALAIHRALRAVAGRSSAASILELERALDSAPAFQVVEPLLDLIRAEPYVRRGAVHNAVRDLTEKTPSRETLKTCIALLGLLGNPSDNQLLITAGAHTEFTRTAIDAIVALNEEPADMLLSLAPMTRNWGRVDSIKALLDHITPQVRHFLLRHGIENMWSELDHEVSPRIATECDLLAAITADDADQELVRGVGEVLLSLANGPHGELQQYEHGAAACVALLERLGPIASSLRDLYLAMRLQRVIERDDKLRWSTTDRDRSIALAQAVIGLPIWPGLVDQWLDDRAQRWLAVAAARKLELPYRSRLAAALRGDPLDFESWYLFTNNVTDPEFDEVLALADEILDIASIATGPANRSLDEAGSELAGFPEFGVAGHPTKGRNLLRAALMSPVPIHRRRAIAALAAWPKGRGAWAFHWELLDATHDPVAGIAAEAAELLSRTEADQARLPRHGKAPKRLRMPSPGYGSLARLMPTAFPASLRGDVDEVVRLVRPRTQTPGQGMAMSSTWERIEIGGETINLVYRIYFPEPEPSEVAALTDRQRLVLSCWYTRHCDGHVRERHLRNIISSAEPWVAPFILHLLGEYVSEIGQIAADHLAGVRPDVYHAFAAENPGFMNSIRARVVSYYRRYYYWDSIFVAYPPYRFLAALGLWSGPEARRWIRSDRLSLHPRSLRERDHQHQDQSDEQCR